MERHLSEGGRSAMALELITGEPWSQVFTRLPFGLRSALGGDFDDSKWVPLLANDLSAGAANTLSVTWKSTSQYARLNYYWSPQESQAGRHPWREQRGWLCSECWGHGSPMPYPCLCAMHAPCIPASPCPQLAPSPAPAYPPASALRVSLGICFGLHLAISFSRRFPPSIWSSFPTTFPAQSTAVLGQGVATKHVPVQLHLRILPHHDHQFTQLTSVFVGNHLYPPVFVRRNCL